MPSKFERVPEIKIIVLGVVFQAFIEPEIQEAVFSQSGVARALKIDEKTVRRYLASKYFKYLRDGTFARGSLLTEVSSTPISVVTQTDLVFLVQIAAERNNPVAKSMQDASFAVLLQESVDLALGVKRNREDYIQSGTNLRLQLEYIHSYHSMKNTTFDRGHGVTGLCKVNKQVSTLAVPDADERRRQSKFWRRKCSGEETVKITIGNAVHEKAVEASKKETLDMNLNVAAIRTSQIYDLLDAPFPI
jgi:hypothetical protein